MASGQSPKFDYFKEELENVKSEFLQLLAAIPDKDWNRRLPGERWTAKQELRHVAQALSVLPADMRRAATGHGGWLLANTPVRLRDWANGYLIIPLISRKETRASIAAEYEQAHAALLDLLAPLPGETWSKGAKFGEYRTVEQIAHHPAEHFAEHKVHLRRVLGLGDEERGR